MQGAEGLGGVSGAAVQPTGAAYGCSAGCGRARMGGTGPHAWRIADCSLILRKNIFEKKYSKGYTCKQKRTWMSSGHVRRW